MDIGGTIAFFREKRKVDQKTLADALKVTVTYISLVENGKKEPSLSFIRSAARYFGVPTYVVYLHALQGIELKTKEEQEAFEAAGDMINLLIDALISKKNASKSKASRGKMGKSQKQRKKVNV